MDKIPLAKPYLGEEEVRAVTEVVRSGILSLGPKLPEFERKFAQFVGTKFAIAVNSGTSGLHLCMKALNIKPRDEVITTPFSFVASSNPIIFEGARPVFVDIEEKTYNIDPHKLEKAINRRTKAIVLVHLFGRPCNMDLIMKIALKKGIPIIEDTCEALGATYKGKKVGTFGKASVFAFYPNKQITTGEGGIICTDDDEVAGLCRSLRNQGRDDSGEWLNHVRLGYNYRLDEMSCAIGIEQIKKIGYILKRRQQIAAIYSEALRNTKKLITPYIDQDSDISWWVYYLRIKEGVNRDKVLRYLNEKGISARAYFDPPIHLQPIYKKLFSYSAGAFPVAEKVSKSGFIIPFFVELRDEEIKKVFTTIKEAVRI